MPKDEKNKLFSKCVNEYGNNISSIYKKSQNYSIELYDDLDLYFRKNSGNDNIYKKMNAFLKKDREKFVNLYSESIKSVLDITNKILVADMKSIVMPYLNKEDLKNNKQKQVEEIKNKYSFKYDVIDFINKLKTITKREVPEFMINDLAKKFDEILLTNYAKIDQMGMDVTLKIQQMYKSNTINITNDSYTLLENYYIYFDSFKTQQYDNNLLNSFLVDSLRIDVENLSKQEKEMLDNLTNEYKKKFNIFLFKQISEIYLNRINYIKNNYGVEYLVKDENKIEQRKESKT